MTDRPPLEVACACETHARPHNPTMRENWEHSARSVLREAARTIRAQAAEIERLAAFKTLVHQRLDALGIPPGEGECRISSRLDCVEAEIERLREALQEALPYVPEHHVPVMHKIRAALGDAP